MYHIISEYKYRFISVNSQPQLNYNNNYITRLEPLLWFTFTSRYVFFFANSLVPFFYTTRIEVVFTCPILLHHQNRSRFPLSHSFTSQGLFPHIYHFTWAFFHLSIVFPWTRSVQKGRWPKVM